MAGFARIGLVLAVLFPHSAVAKVVFTGYGNFQMQPHAWARIHGDAPALSKLALADAEVEGRGFTLDSIGLFAAANLKEGMDFLVDFSYRQIGSTTKETRIQYAYLEHMPWQDFTYRLGKFTLPFGYYNQNRFYSFQRVELSPPVFQSAILGLPISDVGASAQRRFQTRFARVNAELYAVNGYGASAADAKKFRSATLPGSLTLAANLAPSNNNPNLAFGGRLAAAELGGRNVETGVSYYGGPWNSAGTKYFQMGNVHVHALSSSWDFLAEYLHLDVQGDPGFIEVLDDTHWRTDGYFLTAAHPGPRVRDMPLTPYVSAEGYVSRGHHGAGQERLQGYRAGLTLQPMGQIQVKAEYGFLTYALPLRGLGDLKLDVHNVLLGLTLTF
ncbi:MAG: hypothetical protein HYZ74_07545 [Elusimicrobia bacterium]|nr:hypothetical protein [Elusimicrobiota bacterium]